MLNRLLLAALCVASVSQAALVRLDVTERSDVLDGHAFGKTGAYERITGRAYFAVDPKLAVNQVIADLDKAPRNKDALVEFSADFFILRPKDSAKGNGDVFYEVSNRGGKTLLSNFDRAAVSPNPRKPEEFGDGFLLNEGYTLLWVGWQFDVAANLYWARVRERLSAPPLAIRPRARRSAARWVALAVSPWVTRCRIRKPSRPKPRVRSSSSNKRSSASANRSNR